MSDVLVLFLIWGCFEGIDWHNRVASWCPLLVLGEEFVVSYILTLRRKKLLWPIFLGQIRLEFRELERRSVDHFIHQSRSSIISHDIWRLLCERWVIIGPSDALAANLDLLKIDFLHAAPIAESHVSLLLLGWRCNAAHDSGCLNMLLTLIPGWKYWKHLVLIPGIIFKRLPLFLTWQVLVVHWLSLIDRYLKFGIDCELVELRLLSLRRFSLLPVGWLWLGLNEGISHLFLFMRLVGWRLLELVSTWLDRVLPVAGNLIWLLFIDVLYLEETLLVWEIFLVICVSWDPIVLHIWGQGRCYSLLVFIPDSNEVVRLRLQVDLRVRMLVLHYAWWSLNVCIQRHRAHL